MQVNLNCNCPKPQQSFGMAVHSNDAVNKIIQKRIKNSTKLEKLGQIIDNAKNNNVVDVSLFANPDGKTICANIYSLNPNSEFFKQINENIFTRTLGGGIVGFIDKSTKIAKKAALKILEAEKIANNDIFNKMK